MPNFSKELFVSHRHLLLPVKNGSEKLTFNILRDGQMVREFNIELDRSGSPDWWAAYDLSAFSNQTVNLVLISGELSAIESSSITNLIRMADDPLDSDNLYHETLRPQFHFTSRRGWNNDPNGLVFLDGTWHMFYQHNPFGVGWGNMHWGHAVSQDLLHWEEQPIALYQRSLTDMAYSGGGFIDWTNSSGYGSVDNPPVIIAFTSTGRGECLAYSTDQARTFVEFPENPVIKHYGRDPKIFWYAPQAKWVMIVFEEVKPYPTADECLYAIYDSQDLKTWTRRSHLTDLWECPELFSLPLDGDPQQVRWVMYGARRDKAKSMCLIGTFDGEQFIPEIENEVSHYGPAFYAAQAFSDAPEQRCIMLGWLAGASYPDMPFSQGMTVPLELSLRSTQAGPRLFFYPVHELETLRTGCIIDREKLSVDQANSLLSQVTDELLDLNLVIHANDRIVLDLRGHSLTIDPAQYLVEFQGIQGAIASTDHPISIRVLIDRAVTEIFINQGEAAFSAMTLPAGDQTLSLNGPANILKLQVYALHSIW